LKDSATLEEIENNTVSSFASKGKSDLIGGAKVGVKTEMIGSGAGGNGLGGFAMATKLDASTSVPNPTTTVLHAQTEQAMTGDGGLLGWVMAGVAAIVATLTSAVAALYKAQISDLREQLAASRESMKAANAEHRDELSRLDIIEHELRKEIEVCKTDREDLRVCLAKMEERQRIMENRVDKVESQVQKGGE
jgi:hypothetical protein